MSAQIKIRGLAVGGDAPIRVESMLKIPLTDVDGCAAQCRRLAECGCEIVRVALPTAELAAELGRLIKAAERDCPDMRLMADVHFDPDIAVAAMRAGCASVRINPGNMSPLKLTEMIRAAKDMDIVIRIGANGGSLGNHQMEKAKGDRALALFYAVEEQMELLLKNGFDRSIILSAKSSHVPECVRANQFISHKYKYPMHIGVTEAGSGIAGIVKGAAGISLMLSSGIGSTLRVSLTGEPEDEVRVGYAILSALELRQRGATLTSCPTCGRRRIDVRKLITIVEPLMKGLPDGFRVAVMGCEVNGPREAKDADFGVAGTPNGAIMFSHGAVIGECSLDRLPEMMNKYCERKNG